MQGENVLAVATEKTAVTKAQYEDENDLDPQCVAFPLHRLHGDPHTLACSRAVRAKLTCCTQTDVDHGRERRNLNAVDSDVVRLTGAVRGKNTIHA